MRVVLLVLLSYTLLQEARAEDGAKTCFPDCSPGYVCNPNTGTCVEACNPACGTGMRCSADRVCMPLESAASIAAATLAAPAAPPGSGRVCIKRKFNAVLSAVRWTIQLDGETVGAVGAGNEQCFAAPAGSHKVTLTFNNPNNGAKVEATKTVDIVTHRDLSIEARLSGLTGSNIVFE